MNLVLTFSRVSLVLLVTFTLLMIKNRTEQHGTVLTYARDQLLAPPKTPLRPRIKPHTPLGKKTTKKQWEEIQSKSQSEKKAI